MKIEEIKTGSGQPLFLIAGPCVVENEEMIFETATTIKEITGRLGIPYIFKSSYKKANRTSGNSFTGIGDELALEILGKVRKELDLPVLTDIHTAEDAMKAKDYVDVLQIPAFLCRQSDLLEAAAKTGKVINIKKGQFLAPEDMRFAAEKVKAAGNEKVWLTERGTTFGYHNLVVDMRSFVIMKELGYPVIMDATHSVQLPSKGNISGGEPKFIKPLARAATAVGIDGLFLEVHPDPVNAKSDAGSQLKLSELENLLLEIIGIDKVIKSY